MERIDIKIGFQCNNRCLFCIQGERRYSEPDKSEKEIRDILRRMRKNHNGVVFTGGEPTIRPELLDLVRYAKEIGYRHIQIQSNGRMFAYPEYCQALIRAGCNEFSPALHGSTSRIHDSLTRAPGSFNQTVRGIRNLKALGQHIITNSVVTKMNYKDLPALARLLVSLGVDQFQFAFMHINPVIAHDSSLIRKLVPRYQEAVPYMKRGIEIGEKAGIRVMVEATPYCFMKGYEKYVSEQYIPFSSVVDGKKEITDYGSYRKNIGKSKGPKCSQCIYNGVCEGPWAEYPRIFGWSELKPVYSDPEIISSTGAVDEKESVKRGKGSKEDQSSSGKVFLVMTGFLCNNDCVMCSVKPKALQYVSRSTKEIIKDMERGIKSGYENIEFTGGEPTTRDDVLLLIKKAKKLGYRDVALGTNARTSSSLSFLKELQRNGLTRLVTTVYGPTPKVHDKVTRVRESFRQTIQGVRNSLRLGIMTSVNTVVFNMTVGSLRDTGLFLFSLGVRHWTLLDLIPDGYVHDQYSLFSVHPESLQNALKRIGPVLPKFGQVLFMDFPYCLFPPSLLKMENCHFINAKERTEIIKQVGYNPKRFQEKSNTYYDIHKTRVRKCSKCVYRDECGGVWVPFPDSYGESFIKPFIRRIDRDR